MRFLALLWRRCFARQMTNASLHSFSSNYRAHIVLPDGGMATESQSAAIVVAPIKIDLIEALQHVIDRNCRRLLKAARDDWERLFGGKEPADECVSVHVHSAAETIEKRAVPGSGFLPKRVSRPKSKTARALCLTR